MQVVWGIVVWEGQGQICYFWISRLFIGFSFIRQVPLSKEYLRSLRGEVQIDSSGKPAHNFRHHAHGPYYNIGDTPFDASLSSAVPLASHVNRNCSSTSVVIAESQCTIATNRKRYVGVNVEGTRLG